MNHLTFAVIVLDGQVYDNQPWGISKIFGIFEGFLMFFIFL